LTDPASKNVENEGADTKKYKAPALEKGLDVLSLLSSSARELKFPEITAALGRSQSELFRIVHVLVQRGYVDRSPTGTYRLTNQLFRLGMEQPPVRDLIGTASPVMRTLTHTIGQSCHLAVRSQDQIVVIHRIEAPGEIGFSVRIGYRRSIGTTTSGLVIFAFQPTDTRAEIIDSVQDSEEDFDIKRFLSAADITNANGFAAEPSKFVRGIMDLSYPILENGVAIAALTIPFVDSEMNSVSRDETLEHLKRSSLEISANLLKPGTRPSIGEE